MYEGFRQQKLVGSLNEFMHLNIGQIRFFLRKRNEREALETKSKELNEKLKAQQAKPKES